MNSSETKEIEEKKLLTPEEEEDKEEKEGGGPCFVLRVSRNDPDSLYAHMTRVVSHRKIETTLLSECCSEKEIERYFEEKKEEEEEEKKGTAAAASMYNREEIQQVLARPLRTLYEEIFHHPLVTHLLPLASSKWMKTSALHASGCLDAISDEFALEGHVYLDYSDDEKLVEEISQKISQGTGAPADPTVDCVYLLLFGYQGQYVTIFRLPPELVERSFERFDAMENDDIEHLNALVECLDCIDDDDEESEDDQDEKKEVVQMTKRVKGYTFLHFMDWCCEWKITNEDDFKEELEKSRKAQKVIDLIVNQVGVSLISPSSIHLFGTVYFYCYDPYYFLEEREQEKKVLKEMQQKRKREQEKERKKKRKNKSH